jgi:hypothetical protein
MAFPQAPDYDNVRLGGPDGLRYPLEVGKAAFVVGKEVDIDFSKTPATVVLTAQQLGNYFTFANAAGASVVQFPFNSGSKTFSVANHSGQAVTVQIAPATAGGAASTGVSVATGFRQLLCIDRQVADVRPLAAAIAY